MKLISRLADPSSGRIRVGDVNLRDVAARSRHRSLRMVPQDGFLFDTTVRENVRAGRVEASDRDVEAAFEDLGLGGWVASLPKGSIRRSASAARPCRSGSGSSWRSPARRSPTPAC